MKNMIPTCAMRWSKSGTLQQQWVYIPDGYEDYHAVGEPREWRDVPTEDGGDARSPEPAALVQVKSDMKLRGFLDALIKGLSSVSVANCTGRSIGATARIIPSDRG